MPDALDPVGDFLRDENGDKAQRLATALTLEQPVPMDVASWVIAQVLPLLRHWRRDTLIRRYLAAGSGSTWHRCEELAKRIQDRDEHILALLELKPPRTARQLLNIAKGAP